MPRTLLDVANEVTNMRVLVKLRARELTKFVCLKILEHLVRVTPVDTSTALSNWRIAVGGSGYGATPIPAFFPGTGGSTQLASAARAIELAKEALKGAQPGKALAIINAVPYLKRLNEGSSTQAPAGFVEAAILVGREAVRTYNFNQRLKADIRRGSVAADS